MLCFPASGSFDLGALRRAAADWPGLDGMDLARLVSCTQSYAWSEGTWTGTDAPPRRPDAAARHVVPDPDVHPIRGQVVVIANPGIEEFYIDHSTPAPDVIYLFPHRDTVVLGGTMVDGDWDTEPRPEVAERILADCAVAEPRVREAPVLAHRVGLRPGRPEVRLEAVPLDDGRVLWHNYGHGGAGVSMAWGCAAEIAAAVTG